MTDQQLLAYYLDHHPEAFGRIVERHLPLVYHAAIRQVGATNAEDITQIVFALLSQRIRELTDRQSLAGWLHEATRYCCRNYQRAEYRRRKHESEAAMQREMVAAEDSSHEHESDMKAMLDDALARLNPTEREAVLLRYLENRSIEETAAALAIAPAAAAKRAIRGLNKLRVILSKKGVAVPLATLGTLLAAQSAQAVPAGLQVAASVAPGSTTISCAAATLGHGMHNGGSTFAASFIKIAAAIALVVGFAGVMVAFSGHSKKDPVITAAKPNPEVAVPAVIATGSELLSAQQTVSADVAAEPPVPAAAAADQRAGEKLLSEMRILARGNNLRAVRALLLTTDDAEGLLGDSIAVGVVNTEMMLTTAERRFAPDSVRQELEPSAFFLRPVTERQWLITGDLIPPGSDPLATRMVWHSDRWKIDLRTRDHGGPLPTDLRETQVHVINVLRATELASEDLKSGRIGNPRELVGAIRKYGSGVSVGNLK